MNYLTLWMHLLNAELDPGARVELTEHLRRLLGPDAPVLEDSFFDQQAATLSSLREIWAQHKGSGAGTDELEVLFRVSGGVPKGSPLDAILAPGLGSAPATPAQLVQQLLRGCLLGFAVYLRDHAYAEEPLLVDRCSGISPDKRQADHWGYGPGFPFLADEECVTRQLGGGVDGSFARCGKLFVRVGRGDYCSKSCRDRSFALARRRRNPRYDADKQRRYRQRQRQAHGSQAY